MYITLRTDTHKVSIGSDPDRLLHRIDVKRVPDGDLVERNVNFWVVKFPRHRGRNKPLMFRDEAIPARYVVFRIDELDKMGLLWRAEVYPVIDFPVRFKSLLEKS